MPYDICMEGDEAFKSGASNSISLVTWRVASLCEIVTRRGISKLSASWSPAVVFGRVHLSKSAKQELRSWHLGTRTVRSNF